MKIRRKMKPELINKRSATNFYEKVSRVKSKTRYGNKAIVKHAKSLSLTNSPHSFLSF